MAGRTGLAAAAAALAVLLVGCGGGATKRLPPGAAFVPAGAAAFVSADERAAPILAAVSAPSPPVDFFLPRLGHEPVVVERTAPPARALADDGAFVEAMRRLPGNAALRGYVSGAAVVRALDRVLRRAGLPAGLSRSFLALDWIALAATPAEGGFRLQGTVAARLSQEPRAFEPTLPAELSAGAEAAVVFSGLDIPLGALVADLDRIAPSLARQLALAQAALGLSLAGDVVPALAGEAALARYREGTVFVVRLDAHGEAVMRRLLERLGPILQVAKLGALQPLSGGVYRLTLADRDLRVFVALRRGKLLLASDRRALARVRSGGRTLAGETRYRDLSEAADVPARVVALAYLARPGASALLAVAGKNGRFDTEGFLAFE